MDTLIRKRSTCGVPISVVFVLCIAPQFIPRSAYAQRQSPLDEFHVVLEGGAELKHRWGEADIAQPYGITLRGTPFLQFFSFRIGGTVAATYNPTLEPLFGGIVQYRRELPDLEGSRFGDFYLGVEFSGNSDTNRMLGAAVSVTVPKVLDLTGRAGWDFKQEVVYAGVSIGTNVIRRKPASERFSVPAVPAGDACLAAIYNYTQEPVQKLFFVANEDYLIAFSELRQTNMRRQVDERKEKFRNFVRARNENDFLNSPSVERALDLVEMKGLPLVSGALDDGLEEAWDTQACREAMTSEEDIERQILATLWQRLEDSRTLIFTE